MGQILAVFIGGGITLIANILLQRWSFAKQDQTNLMNLRTDAYLDLLAHILTDEKTARIDTGKFHSALTRAATYGSPEIKELLIPIVIKSIRDAEVYRDSFPNMKNRILNELNEGKRSGSKHW